MFRAEDQLRGKSVALKFFDPLLLGHSYRLQCFDREAHILCVLRGQQDVLQLVEPKSELTLRLVDPGTGFGFPVPVPFFVTELGRLDIKQHIYGGEIRPLKNLIYFRAMCRGVQRLHALQICHRDLKPENFLLLRGRAEPCVSDFGTARILDGTVPALVEEYDGWRGDGRYTAPEMFAGLDRDVALFYCGDMFSLGAILFEMFTRTNLVTLVYGFNFWQNLSANFHLIDPDKRHSIFVQLVPSIAQSMQLPDIYDFGQQVPKSIRDRLNGLYKSLASPDYRSRVNDFRIVFNEINGCINILRHESQYRRLMAIRRERREQQVIASSQ